MIEKTIKILLIEDNMGDYRLIEEMLKEIKDFIPEVKHADRLVSGIDLIGRTENDIILTDLTLPDSCGIHTFYQVLSHAKGTPIIILTGFDDVNMAIKALREGAQDYLIKEKLNSDLLKRSICYAIERYKVQEKYRTLSLIDELTGLFNRRGFLTFAEQQLSLHARMNKSLYLLYSDLDSMKWINDTYGHKEGDFALIIAAEILKKTFRASDVVARIGGDEFAVVFSPTDSDENHVKAIISRLRQNLYAYNRNMIHGYSLSLSLGVVCQNPKLPYNLNELIRQADDLMYNEKRDKRALSPSGRRIERREG